MKVKRKRVRIKTFKRTVLKSEPDEKLILLSAAKQASSKAIRSSQALGLSIKIIRENQIITVNADNSEKVERTLARENFDSSKLKKGIRLPRK